MTKDCVRQSVCAYCARMSTHIHLHARTHTHTNPFGTVVHRKKMVPIPPHHHEALPPSLAPIQPKCGNRITWLSTPAHNGRVYTRARLTVPFSVKYVFSIQSKKHRFISENSPSLRVSRPPPHAELAPYSQFCEHKPDLVIYIIFIQKGGRWSENRT